MLEQALRFTLKWEGGLSNDPVDIGGRTFRGITQSTYNNYRDMVKKPAQDVVLMTTTEMHQIYETLYWKPSKANLMDTPLNIVMFDTAVNFGVGGAVQFLQEVLGVTADGSFGPETQQAFNRTTLSPVQLAEKIIQARISYRHQRVKESPSQIRFLKGWLNRDNDLAVFIRSLKGVPLVTAESWKLIAPRDNWRNARDIKAEDVDLLKFAAASLGLLCKVDTAQKKVYMDYDVQKIVPTKGVSYPKVDLPYEPEVSSNSPYFCDQNPRGHLIRLNDQTIGAKISEHFVLGEFMCKGPEYRKYVRVHTNLVHLLESIRRRVGPLIITSAYRPAPYNKAIGGEDGSWHIAGVAADITPADKNVSIARLLQVCNEEVGAKGGVGYYPDKYFVHVDVRGYSARWDG